MSGKIKREWNGKKEEKQRNSAKATYVRRCSLSFFLRLFSLVCFFHFTYLFKFTFSQERLSALHAAAREREGEGKRGGNWKLNQDYKDFAAQTTDL